MTEISLIPFVIGIICIGIYIKLSSKICKKVTDKQEYSKKVQRDMK